MDNLSFHITDITANSIRAKASDIEIDIQIKDTSICIRIADNGCGMDPETVSLIRNPFYTTRTTRKVGLGLPFLIQNAEQTGGNVEISSIQGKGTVVVACFVSSHIDCLENMPLSHPKVMLYLKELIANQIVASG